METRMMDQIYLISYAERQIVGAKLPSNIQVLRVLFSNMRKVKLSLRLSATLVIKEVEVFWEKARIPVRKQQRSIEKLEYLYKEWKNLNKSKNRQTATQKQKEIDFIDKFNDLFDIAHGNAMDMMEIEEDKQFLICQREKERVGSLIGPDRSFALQEELERLQNEAKQSRQQKLFESQQLNDELVVFESSSSSNEEFECVVQNPTEIENFGDSEVEAFGPSSPKKKRGRRQFITPKLVAVFDTCKVSDRNAVRLLIATCEALQLDVSELVINRSSIYRCRKYLRTEHVKKLRENFLKKDVGTVVVHFDGKLLPSLSGKENVDRLPIVISFNGNEQLLSVPIINSGTGKDQALAVYNTLVEWNLVDNVQGICCDTTSSNMGRLQGACVILEQKLNRDLLYLPCRHHIFEIILRSIFDKNIAQSTSPNIPLFKKFQQNWSQIKSKNIKPGIEDKYVKLKLKDVTENIIKYCNERIAENQPREDYLELLNLSIIFLGGKSYNDNSIRAPGAFHHARWMAKAIYCLKIFLYREDFCLSADEKIGVRDVCIFLVRIYIKFWFSATNAIEAPRLDLECLKSFYAYRNINSDISEIGLKKFSNHLWYLSPENSALAFFDDHVSQETKKRMVQALNNENDENNIKKINIAIDYKIFVKKTIDEFIYPNSINFFRRFDIKTSFLNIDPQFWNINEDYQDAKKKLQSLKVVNDCAERAVKLIEDFNSIITKNEEQKQYLLQIVADYRKNHPDSKKCTLMEG